ncbi:hypothetical protein MAR_008364, partial [Mya arenaria]
IYMLGSSHDGFEEYPGPIEQLCCELIQMTVCEADEHQEREAGCREKVQRIEIAVQVARSIAMRKMVTKFDYSTL